MDMSDVQALADRLMAAQRERRAKKHSDIWEPTSTPASALGYKCDRRLVYMRLYPRAAAPISEELASIFEEGDLHETDVKRELLALGFEPVEGQRSFRDERLDISGRIDCQLAITEHFRSETVPTEIKSCSDSPPTTAEGLRDHSGIHARQYAQMESYLFLTEKPFGLFLFKQKMTGLWTVVPVPIDYEYCETLLQRAERVRDHVRAGTLPDRLADRSECNACPWMNTMCHPDDAAIDPLLLVNDTELLTQLERREALDPSRREYKQIDDAVKHRFKLTAGERFVVGNEHGFLVQKKKHGNGVRIEFTRLSQTA